MKNSITKIFSAGLLSLIMTGCGEEKKESKELLGAGATFPFPLYSKMFDHYGKETQIQVNYQAIGSGGGQRQIKAKTVDFGGSDAFVSDKKLASFPAKLLHVPAVLGDVTLTYNLPESPELKFSSEVLANIFLGTITKWNDPKISALNEGIALPNLDITVVRRSDGSGTTAIFTDYLSKVSPAWKEKVGKGKSVKWPVGLGAKGNDGVTGVIKQKTGSISYVELAYTIQNNLPVASIQNLAGNFIKPSIASTSLAAAGDIPEDTRVSLTNTTAEQGYPIAGFTWILVYQDQKYNDRTPAKSKMLIDLLWWMTHEGQKYAEPLHYAPLPSKAMAAAEKILKSINYNGTPIL